MLIITSPPNHFDRLLSAFGRALLTLAKRLPLSTVAALGRGTGSFIYFIDARHRQVAITNLTTFLGTEVSGREIRNLARENFRRIGENFACALKTSTMSVDQISRVLEVVGNEQFACEEGEEPQSRVFALGHFGNFELHACGTGLPANAQIATTYRGLRQPSLDRLLGELRAHSGCHFFERRRDAAKLKAAMNGTGVYLGLLADQHAGDRGLRLPLLGRECSVSSAPAVFALRYRCPLHVTVCYRVAPARWCIEFSDPIPTRENGMARSPEAIMGDVYAEFEKAIRRDPANWFWVHNRWKPLRSPSRRRSPISSPEVLEPTGTLKPESPLPSPASP